MNARLAVTGPSRITPVETGIARVVRPMPGTAGWTPDLRNCCPRQDAHVVFTLPHELAPLALQNKRVVYDLLFKASSATLIEVARNPERLGADIGFFSVLLGTFIWPGNAHC